ncbi:MAG: NifB/NifX family molybdenum-iron cluster-binding protein [Caldisericia bacterium]|nr:NifB/NifX family molybdenum-iron cluster-binding protein [Caldisericia bacterium]MDD4614716.1 NifB/NifX family molybdenum-iron cluster-binding protein [Caldisericia bacterium]
MRIAFCVQNDKGVDSTIDSRFGRSPGFLVYDTDDESTTYFTNAQNLSAPQGAGIQSAQTIAAQNVQAVVAHNCGPKAYQVLLQAGIEVYMSQDTIVKEAVQKFKNGELEKAASSNVPGHW